MRCIRTSLMLFSIIVSSIDCKREYNLSLAVSLKTVTFNASCFSAAEDEHSAEQHATHKPDQLRREQRMEQRTGCATDPDIALAQSEEFGSLQTFVLCRKRVHHRHSLRRRQITACRSDSFPRPLHPQTARIITTPTDQNAAAAANHSLAQTHALTSVMPEPIRSAGICAFASSVNCGPNNQHTSNPLISVAHRSRLSTARYAIYALTFGFAEKLERCFRWWYNRSAYSSEYCSHFILRRVELG